LADAKDLKSFSPQGECGFKSRPGHQQTKGLVITITWQHPNVAVLDIIQHLQAIADGALHPRNLLCLSPSWEPEEYPVFRPISCLDLDPEAFCQFHIPFLEEGPR